MSGDLPLYTWEEIRRHNTDKDCWVVLYGKVLDVTAFLNHHPGGLDPINDLGGYDITNSFESIGHTTFAEEKSQKFIIGKVDPNSKPPVVKRKDVVDNKPINKFQVQQAGPLPVIKKAVAAFLVVYLVWVFLFGSS